MMRARKANERGMSLIEALVATAILAVAIVVALTVYDASRKAFAKGENATEQQESVRIAFDLMTSVREACPSHEPHITRSNDRYAGHASDPVRLW